jgi:hypothetical protein
MRNAALLYALTSLAVQMPFTWNLKLSNCNFRSLFFPVIRDFLPAKPILCVPIVNHDLTFWPGFSLNRRLETQDLLKCYSDRPCFTGNFPLLLLFLYSCCSAFIFVTRACSMTGFPLRSTHTPQESPPVLTPSSTVVPSIRKTG